MCCAGVWEGSVLAVDAEALGRLMPMALWLDRTGIIRGAGPALEKLCADSLPGQRLGAQFEVLRPRLPEATSASEARPADDRAKAVAGRNAGAEVDLAELLGARVYLRLRRTPATTLRGVAVPARVAGADGLILNLTFGIGLADAVRDHGLTTSDFAVTDLAMEFLYLQEAKALVMGELHALNARLQDARRTAEAQAMSDPLTGLANRRALDQDLARAAAVAARGGAPFALAHLDLDHFKAVNDLLGHPAGDFMLGRVAAILREETRRADLVARVGGDEFVLLLRGAHDPAGLMALGARIIARIEEPCLHEGRPCRISASIGIVLSASHPGADPAQMLAAADVALYASKRRGRGCCTVAPPPPTGPPDDGADWLD